MLIEDAYQDISLEESTEITRAALVSDGQSLLSAAPITGDELSGDILSKEDLEADFEYVSAMLICRPSLFACIV